MATDGTVKVIPRPSKIKTSALSSPKRPTRSLLGHEEDFQRNKTPFITNVIDTTLQEFIFCPIHRASRPASLLQHPERQPDQAMPSCLQDQGRSGALGPGQRREACTEWAKRSEGRGPGWLFRTGAPDLQRRRPGGRSRERWTLALPVRQQIRRLEKFTTSRLTGL